MLLQMDSFKNSNKNTSKTNVHVRILALITYLAMVTINSLANLLPINGITTGEVSDIYQNLFTPAGYTFAIWILIYILLAFYTVYQLCFLDKNRSETTIELLNKVSLIFSVSSIANILWIFAWHYDFIALSFAFMISILICIISVMRLINKKELSVREEFLVKLPFSVYMGWITFTTITNATAMLVSLGWDGFGIPEEIWAITIIIAGILIGAAVIIKNKDVTYGLVLIWAYIGILIKHISPNGFSGQYPNIIATLITCMVLLMPTLVFVFMNKIQKLN